MWKIGAIAAAILGVASVRAWVETDRPDVSAVGPAAVKEWADFRVKWAEDQFKATGWKRMPSPNFWPGEVVYQIQVDRFNNGDLKNDLLNIKKSEWDQRNASSGYGIWDWRQGGDLEGIRRRIPYLKDLGISALWITPVLKHDGSYHGYCTTDPTDIDPGFGTKDDFRRLVKECHDNGIYVVLDIVVNHLCDTQTSYSGSYDHSRCANDLNSKFWSGVSGGSPAQAGINFSPNFFKPLRSPFFFNRCGPNAYDQTAGEGAEAIYGDFVPGMFDFDTRNWDFHEIFTKLMNFWIAYADIDGFRLDAVKHVSSDFTAYLSTIARDYALSLGKRDFLVIGEVAGSIDWIGQRLGRMYANPRNLDDHGIVPEGAIARMKTIQSIYLKHPVFPFAGMTAVYDFMASGRSKDVFLGLQAPVIMENYFKSREFRTFESQADARYSWTILEIHDWPRFLQSIPGDWGKAQMALAYLLTMQGTPVIYYGIEQGFNGNCNFDNIKVGAVNDVKANCGGSDHARFRQDMFMGSYRLRSAISSIDGLAYIGPATQTLVSDWTTDPYLRRDHDLYKLTKKILRIRKSCGPLQWGITQFRWVDYSNEGLMAYSRLDGVYEVVTVINMKFNAIGLPAKIAIDNNLNPKSLDGTKYKNLLNDQQFAWVGRENGQAYLYFSGFNQIGGRQVLILVHESRVGTLDQAAGVLTCKGVTA